MTDCFLLEFVQTFKSFFFFNLLSFNNCLILFKYFWVKSEAGLRASGLPVETQFSRFSNRFDALINQLKRSLRVRKAKFHKNKHVLTSDGRSDGGNTAAV